MDVVWTVSVVTGGVWCGVVWCGVVVVWCGVVWCGVDSRISKRCGRMVWIEWCE